jgi:hypothetical protein
VYQRPTAKETVSSLPPPDGMVLAIGLFLHAATVSFAIPMMVTYLPAVPLSLVELFYRSAQGAMPSRSYPPLFSLRCHLALSSEEKGNAMNYLTVAAVLALVSAHPVPGCATPKSDPYAAGLGTELHLSLDLPQETPWIAGVRSALETALS